MNQQVDVSRIHEDVPPSTQCVYKEVTCYMLWHYQIHKALQLTQIIIASLNHVESKIFNNIVGAIAGSKR